MYSQYLLWNMGIRRVSLYLCIAYLTRRDGTIIYSQISQASWRQKKFRLHGEIIAETEAYCASLGQLFYKRAIEILEKRWIDCIALTGKPYHWTCSVKYWHIFHSHVDFQSIRLVSCISLSVAFSLTLCFSVQPWAHICVYMSVHLSLYLLVPFFFNCPNRATGCPFIHLHVYAYPVPCLQFGCLFAVFWLWKI